MILSFINIRKVPLEVLKLSGFVLSFQHFLRDLAIVNDRKIIFDPSIVSDFVINCVNYVSVYFSCSIQMILSYNIYRKDIAPSVDINGKIDSGLRENTSNCGHHSLYTVHT